MKKITFYITVLCVSMLSLPLQSEAAKLDSNTEHVVPVSKEIDTVALSARLIELNSINQSDLKAPEKRSIRREQRTIKKQMKVARNGGVYI
ncbi:MAG: hypothetical protein R2852_08400 [Bacteroidia bacterium]